MSPEELEQIADAERERQGKFKHTVKVCVAAGCVSCQSESVKTALESEVTRRGGESSCQVKGVGCMGLCAAGPLVAVGNHVLYQHVTAEDAPALLDSLEQAPVEKLLCPTDVPFFQKQKKIVLENCGNVDPERVEDYIAAGGYTALMQVLSDMTPAQVVTEITRSGLRGRGGAGYPTGLKWSTVAKAAGEKKYVICNADEGDPGAFMDRSVLESDPHAVLEGMAIAAYAVGADQGYIYVRAEYPLAISRLQTAIKQAKQFGLLGSGVFDSPFNLTIDLRLGAGAFVCGEETALMASVEGKRGQPRPRPPFPAESGLFGCPTLINNVETFANIVPIILKGAEWYAAIGTEKSKGTKVFALTGKVCNNGLIEVPMGTPLRTIVEEMGGGAPDGGSIKAVQTGGPSGGCIPAQHLDTPVDYESLTKLGSIMGSGGMIVMDDKTNMVEIARFYMEFCMDESCGKCVPCRAGTVQMHHILGKVLSHGATARDLAKLEELCDMVRNTSLCGLGQTAPNPVMSTLRFFRSEYEDLLVPDTYGHSGGAEAGKAATAAT